MSKFRGAQFSEPFVRPGMVGDVERVDGEDGSNEKTEAEKYCLAGQMTQAFAARDRSRVETYDLGEAKRTEPVSELRPKKQTKVHAGYRSAFSGARCASCVHKRGGDDKNGTCAIVEGEIRPDDVCDLYAPERGDETTNANNYFRAMVERYAKDSTGHEHGADGKFTSGDGRGEHPDAWRQSGATKKPGTGTNENIKAGSKVTDGYFEYEVLGDSGPDEEFVSARANGHTHRILKSQLTPA